MGFPHKYVETGPAAETFLVVGTVQLTAWRGQNRTIVSSSRNKVGNFIFQKPQLGRGHGKADQPEESLRPRPRRCLPVVHGGHGFKLSLRHLGPEAMVFWARLTPSLFGPGADRAGALGELRACPGPGPDPPCSWAALNPFLYYLVLIRAYDLLRAQGAQAINYTWAIT
jgi:hypothetical protein